jgi:predicted murein hydrolase (TIGR00659 family)
MINPYGIISTILFFKIAQKLCKYPILKTLSPLVVAGILTLISMKIFHISYETYHQTASYISFLLIPATISLGYPLYKNVNILTKNKRIIYTAFVIASCFAIVSTFLVAKLNHTNNEIIVSLLPKSITAPIAIEVSKQLHGIPEITICVVVLTGIFGAIFGHKILKLIHIKNDIAIGLAMGASSHVIGTAKCIEKGKPKQIVMSTLALVIVGVLTVLIAPVIWNLLNIKLF